MKEFFSKIWAWVLKNKVVSIVIASVVTAGLACAIILPITLHHDHEFGTELSSNETQHWLECDCGEKKDVENHEAKATYSHNDTHHWKDCVDCGYDLTIAQHAYDQEIAEEAYFKEESSTTVTFFKTCVCGKVGTDTFTVNKAVGTLTGLTIIDKPYDGLAIETPTYTTNSNGIATVEYKIKDADDSTYTTTAPTNAGEYTVKVSIAANRVYTAISETKDFTISKCEISGLSQSFTYNKSNKQTVALPTSIVPESGISLELTFEDANVGASVIGVKVLKDSQETNNYEVKNCTATIDKKEIHIPSLLTKEYDGDEWGGFEYTFTTADGIISGDTVTISFDAGAQNEVVNAGTYNDCPFTNTISTGMENYELVENKCNVEITQKFLRFEDVYVKNYDGTHIVRFDFDDSALDGVAADEGVYVKFEALEYDTPENFPLVNVGYYSQADCGPFKFYTSDNTETDNYTFDDNDFQGEWSGFKLWILDTNPLIIEVLDRFNIEEDDILTANIRQGSVKVGDSIILPGTPDKVYEVLKIEKFHKEQGQATVGEEVGIYIDGMAELTEVSRGDLLYTQGNIPELTTTFFANIYAKTQAEGGRSTPFFDDYKPNIIGLGVSQQATVNLIDVYGKEDTMVAPGDSALVKITLTNALPASLLENLEFTLREESAGSARTTATGVGVDYVESQNFQNSMVATDKFTTEAGTPMVVRLTNTRSETLDTLQFYVSNSSGGGNYLTDFTIKLYNSSFNPIEGTHDNTNGTFTKADTSKWSLAAEDTCYIVITTTSANVDVFAWLS